MPVPEAVAGSTKSGNCNPLKMVTGKPFGITNIGARIMSIFIVGGHEVTRNLNDPSDQTIMQIDVYADFLSAISPQTTSRALRVLLTSGGSKSVRVENRYTEAYGPHELLLNIDGINIYTKTMITCDEDLVGQRRSKSEIDWTLRHAGRRCNAHRDGIGRISTCA